MTWNVMAIVEHGGPGQYLYPTSTKKGIGVELLPGEDFDEKHSFTQFEIYRSDGRQMAQVYRSAGIKGALLVSNIRLAIVFDKVPASRSFFTPIAVGQALAGIGKHRGESFVGHIMYPWLSSVSARRQSVGLSNAEPRMRFCVTDATGAEQTSVMVEIQMSKSPAIASSIVRRLVADRLRDPAFADLPAAHAEWAALAAAPFDGPAKEFTTKAFAPFLSVRPSPAL